MKNRFIKIYTLLTDSFWFLPSLMALGAAAIALATIAYDHTHENKWLSGLVWVWSGSAEGARSVLSVIAGSMMTVVSIVFSLTIITLSQTSSHFGPRVLRNFTSDRGNQLVLGTFIATFIYCLLVLRTINAEDEARFVPFLSVNLGVVLALFSLGVLIYYIHHIAQSIQPENLISGVGGDFKRAIAHIFPKDLGMVKCEVVPPPEAVWSAAYAVTSEVDGYIMGLDVERLIQLASKHDLLIKLEKRPGHFATKEATLLYVVPNERLSEDIAKEIRASYSWGEKRTPHQDVLYPIQQMAEIAAHALSPGINEPFTALTCIDWLGASLRSVACLEMPSSYRHDEDGRLRLIVEHTTFDDLVHASFDQIRIYGSGNGTVMKHLITTIGELAPHLKRKNDCNSLLSYLEIVKEDTNRDIPNKKDGLIIKQAYSHARKALDEQHVRLSHGERISSN